MISTANVARVMRSLGLLLALAVFFLGFGVSGAALWPQDGKSKSGAKQQADEKKDEKRDEKKDEKRDEKRDGEERVEKGEADSDLHS